jgi:5-methylcytosine-specific restriction endonuclease McrA
VSSAVPVELRRLVMRRANGICEYCLVPERVSALDFQIEHIISEKHGGATTSENLACSCVFCNRFKGSDVASVSPTTGQVVRLYHPRRDRWMTISRSTDR